MCLCNCKKTVRKYRPYRDWAGRIKWAWFLECAKCHFPVKMLRAA